MLSLRQEALQIVNDILDDMLESLVYNLREFKIKFAVEEDSSVKSDP